MIIIGKKFDIRVWVLVTSVEPLTVWMFMKPYLRFTAEDYNANQLHNKFSHLTNATVSKGKSQSKVKGKYKIKNNMWTTEDFAQFLENEYSADSLENVIFPQIK